MNYDIIISEFNFSYTNIDVLNNINLRIEKGECLGIIGSNGSGKTTLINCILGSLKGKGQINVLGMKPDNNSLKYKLNIGAVLDNDLLLDYLTPYEYLNFIGKLYKIPNNVLDELISYWIEYFKLSEYKNRIIKYFSHGMRKKVQIIAAIIHDPKLLIIDEPTNGLDIEMIYLLKNTLRTLKDKGTTIILSTHILSFSEELCDKVAIINNKSIQDILSLPLNTNTDTLENIFINIVK